MSKPVKQNIVDLVANMLTDDPDIMRESISEARYPFRKNRRYHNGGGEGQYEAEEVPLDPSGLLGNVLYDYEVNIYGDWFPQTHEMPGESPEVEIGKITKMEILAYDEDNNEIQPSPEQLEVWTKSAVAYFREKLADKVLEKETENMHDGDYDDYDDREHDYDRD